VLPTKTILFGFGGHYTKKFGLTSSRTPTNVPRVERRGGSDLNRTLRSDLRVLNYI